MLRQESLSGFERSALWKVGRIFTQNTNSGNVSKRALLTQFCSKTSHRERFLFKFHQEVVKELFACSRKEAVEIFQRFSLSGHCDSIGRRSKPFRTRNEDQIHSQLLTQYRFAKNLIDLSRALGSDLIFRSTYKTKKTGLLIFTPVPVHQTMLSTIFTLYKH